MLDYDSFMQVLHEVKSSTDAFSWRISMRTYNRVHYIGHASKARLWEPRYKRRKCSIRRLAARRQDARKFYGV